MENNLRKYPIMAWFPQDLLVSGVLFQRDDHRIFLFFLLFTFLRIKHLSAVVVGRNNRIQKKRFYFAPLHFIAFCAEN